MADDANNPALPPVDAPASGLPKWAPLALATAVPALLFLALPPLTKNGLWDP